MFEITVFDNRVLSYTHEQITRLLSWSVLHSNWRSVNYPYGPHC